MSKVLFHFLFPAALFIGAFSTIANSQSIQFSEGPTDMQVYTRDKNDNCSIPIRGSLAGGADSVIVTTYIGNQSHSKSSAGFSGSNFSVNGSIKADTVNYRIGVRTKSGSALSPEVSFDKILCGDAFIIYGQSNAVAGYGSADYTYTSDYIRTYRGSWTVATSAGGRIGVWGLHLSRTIKEKYGIPLAVINGAQGGISIEVLSRNDSDPTNPSAYYGRLLSWVMDAKLDKKVRAFFWHQGEANFSNNAENYYDNFLELRKDIYHDFPAVEQIFAYQIRAGCGGGSWGWNTIFEAQRKLFEDYADIHTVTANADLISGCHYGQYDVKGYERIANWMFPSVDETLYGATYDSVMTSPNLLAAAYTTSAKNEVVLVFDQNMTFRESVSYDANEPMHQSWLKNNSPQFLRNLFVMDSSLNQVSGGRADSNRVTLTLNGTSNYTEITYPRYNLHGSYPEPFLMGTNGTGALGFTSFPISDQLGVEGCMDTSASNYNAQAEIPCLNCCVPELSINQISEEGVFYKIQGRELILNTSENYLLKISDIRGRVVFQKQLSKNIELLPRINLKSGLYIFQFHTKGHRIKSTHFLTN